MLISFFPDGSAEFTRNPDLLKVAEGIAPLRIERMTDIKFDAMSQLYYIQFKTGPFADIVVSWHSSGLVRAELLETHWWDFADNHSPELVNECVKPVCGGPVHFDTYEKAVKVEIAFVEMLREQGYSMR